MKIATLKIKVSSDYEDIIEAIIEENIDSMSILGYNIESFVKESDFTFVNIYSENIETARENLKLIECVIKENEVEINYSYTIEINESEKYLYAYMDILKPFMIDNLTIIPNLKDENNSNIEGNKIYIAKQYAFGTGTHDTTHLALNMLAYYKNEYKKNENKKINTSVADIGCGSGILTLAAYSFGYKDITAVDNDYAAVSCTKENILYNGFDIKNVFLGSADSLEEDEKKFDLVIANIETDVLIEIMPHLVGILRNKDSVLILSGILVLRLKEIEKSILKHNLKIIKYEHTEEWGSMLLALS